jgi:hypothetical protein
MNYLLPDTYANNTISQVYTCNATLPSVPDTAVVLAEYQTEAACEKNVDASYIYYSSVPLCQLDENNDYITYVQK